MPNGDAALCRAARFCNGAAHGGQVVGPTTILPGLLQAWGCEKIPDPQMSGTELQVCPQFTICIILERSKCPFKGIVGLDELTWCCTLRVCKDSKLCGRET